MAQHLTQIEPASDDGIDALSPLADLFVFDFAKPSVGNAGLFLHVSSHHRHLFSRDFGEGEGLVVRPLVRPSNLPDASKME